MITTKNVCLKDYSTMRLGGKCQYLIEVFSEEDLVNANKFCNENSLKSILIGRGSNLIWSDTGYPGAVIVNKIPGLRMVEEIADKQIFEVGAGEIWDEVVQKLVNNGLSGVEYLSLIPGSAGATVIQNVGAYGQEMSKLIKSVKTLDRTTNLVKFWSNSECQFSYRSSIFNKTPDNPFQIISFELVLSYNPPTPPFYSSLDTYLKERNITSYSNSIIRSAVIDIRKSKLPDPNINPNCGSFFKNPVISKEILNEIKASYPDIPYWEDQDKYKLSAAWLIDHSQLPYKEFAGFEIWDKQHLVIINRSGKSTASLLEFTNTITSTVWHNFKVRLIKEPLVIT